MPTVKDDDSSSSSSSIVARVFRSPHTITMLACGGAALGVATQAFSTAGSADAGTTADGLRRGVYGAVGSYAAYSALQGPATHMVRPHAAVWKVAHGLFTVYLLALVVLLFQTPDDAQKLLRFFWNDLGVPLPAKSYGGDCRIYVPGHRSGMFGIVYETCFDEFTLAHVLGWFGKAVAIRHWGLLWAYSIAFELCELTFEHWQPNFNECWWDMWVWDVMICNLLGIYAGMWVVKFMRGRMYDWSGKLKSSPTAKTRRAPRNEHRSPVKGALKQMMVVLTPDSVETYTWQPTESPGRFLKCVFLVVCGLIFDLNAFFLKYVLHVPPSHKFNLYRLFLWFAMSNIAIREYYVFIESPDLSAAKLGSNAWLALAVLIVEILVVVKNGKGQFTAPWPRHVVVAWTIALTVVITYLITWHRKITSASRRDEAASRAPAKKTSSRRTARRAPTKKGLGR